MTDNTTAPLPTDEPTNEELAAAGTIRPLEQLPSPWTIKGNPKAISQPTLKALSPADQSEVMRRAGSTSETAVNNALFGFLRERSKEVRIKCGTGQGATATEREALDQLNQVRLMTEEFQRLEGELSKVSNHRTEYDETGNAVAVPVYLFQGDGRSARQNRMTEIKHQLALLAGHEGEAALKKAARKDVFRNREITQQLEDGREIERRAHALARDERVNEAARRKARLLKGELA